MKNETMKKPENKEVIRPIFPDDYEIVRHVKEDGTIVYEHPTGYEVQTYEETFETIMQSHLDNFKALFELLDEEDRGRFGRLFSALIEQSERQLYEIFAFLGKSSVDIKCTLTCRNDIVYRANRCVGVSIALA